MAKVTTMQRKVLEMLQERRGITHEEIGREFGVSARAITKRLYRARKRLGISAPRREAKRVRSLVQLSAVGCSV